MQPLFLPLPEITARHYRSGGLDAYGLPPEVRHVRDGAVPCRHSLRMLPEGARYLTLAHRPFAGLNPYTETGPIFLGADDLPGAEPSPHLPPFLTSPVYLLRGYGEDERIVYGTGTVTATGDILAQSRALLSRADIAFLHIRSASNNCFHVRVERS